MSTDSAIVSHPLISSEKGKLQVPVADSNAATSRELLERWGAPDEISQESAGHQIWEYHFGLRWNGLILGTFLPIPLVIPVGYEYMSFTIGPDLHLESVRVVFDRSGAGVMCVFNVHGGCFTENKFLCENILPACDYQPGSHLPSKFLEPRPYPRH